MLFNEKLSSLADPSHNTWQLHLYNVNYGGAACSGKKFFRQEVTNLTMSVYLSLYLLCIWIY